jgi:hypothetical protein
MSCGHFQRGASLSVQVNIQNKKGGITGTLRVTCLSFSTCLGGIRAKLFALRIKEILEEGVV